MRVGPRRQFSSSTNFGHNTFVNGLGRPVMDELLGAAESKSDSHSASEDGNRASSTVLKPYYPSSSSSSSMSMYLGFVSTTTYFRRFIIKLIHLAISFRSHLHVCFN